MTRSFAHDHPMVADIRGIGMMAGVEVHRKVRLAHVAANAEGDVLERPHVKWTGDNAIIAWPLSPSASMSARSSTSSGPRLTR